jgi:hypothetical protein
MSEPFGESVRGRLATCSYRAFRPEMGLAVRITRGHPRWRLPYVLAGKVNSLAPDATEWALRDDPAAFVAHYQARMDGLTVEGVAAELAGEFPDGRLVLLCFEDVWGQVLAPALVCHRRAFAEWWQDRIGDMVPELSEEPPA